ncbi:MAG: hypothetical protein RI957_1640 [Verrucomicrobiota bacterium]
MKTLWFFLALIVSAVGQDVPLQGQLEQVYGKWRNAMIQKDYAAWSGITATHRQVIAKNRLNSERRVFPRGIFEVPAVPPALTGLKNVQAKRNGRTAKFVYFGKVDFGVGGEPTDNLLVIDFVQENTGWKYDAAEYVNLAALPEVREELKRGDLAYITKTPEFMPNGIAPRVPVAVPVAKYIAKVYVFCPGRSVDVTVNRVSQHRFGNAKEAELVMGGVVDGKNEIHYSVKGLPGGNGKEAMSIRVYALSQIEGVMPIKAFEYQVPEGGEIQGSATATFHLDAAMSKKLLGK